MESSALCFRAGKTWDCLEVRGILGNYIRDVWVELMVWPFERLMVRPLAVGCLWSHGVLGPRKWVVQPESAVTWELAIFLGTTDKALRFLDTKILSL